MKSTYSIPAVLCATWLVLLVAGCGGSSSTVTNAEDSDHERQAELERLKALGYVDFSPEPAQAEDNGVTAHDPNRSQPGYNLYTVRPLGRAELTDASGNVLRSWSEEGAEFWSRSLLLEGGDLLVVSATLPDRYALRFNWEGELLWRHPLETHHDIRPVDRGGYITLTMENRLLPDIDPEVEVRDNSLSFFTPENGISRSVSLHDLVLNSPEAMQLKPVNSRQELIDLIHANSIRFLEAAPRHGEHPAYGAGNALVCMRNQDSIAIVDRDLKKILWAWGQGELEGPHDATLLDNGHLLIFDNGVRRKWSRVVEVDPLSGAIVWEYRAPNPADFYTAARGAAQRLANGNTLITESNEGHAFEVTPEGEIVWEFHVPHLDQKGHRATIIRLYRYDASVIDPLLSR